MTPLPFLRWLLNSLTPHVSSFLRVDRITISKSLLSLNQVSSSDYLEPLIHFSPSMTNSFIKLLLKERGARDTFRCKNLVLKKKKKQLFLTFIKETLHGKFLGTCASVQRRQWHPTPVLSPRKPHGRRSLVGCSPWGCEESDTTEQLHFHFLLSCIGEGNGNPLQCSCLENPRDREALWAAVYGVAQSRTRLKRLSSSSQC